MYTDSVQSTGNTAEVAGFISKPSVLAIADGGKGIPPKELPCAKGALPGTVQNMHGTVIGKDVVLPGDDQSVRPVPSTGLLY